LPLLGDEAYYNLWASYPALSYTDHPPMIAFMHLFLNARFAGNDLGIRLGAIACVLFSTWIIYLIGKEAFGKRVAIASAVLFNIIPTYFAGGLFLTPEQPLIIFWLLSMYALVKIIKTHKKGYWYLLGLTVGLGLLSKFPMVLIGPGILLFLLLSKDNRYWLTKKEPYLACALALIIFLPVIIWNFQHGFPSLLHHGARIGSPNYLENLAYFVVLQLIMFSPPLFIFACTTFFYDFWRKIKSWDNYSLLFVLISLPAFVAFLLISPFTLVGGHWTSTVYLGITILLCHKVLAAFHHPLKNIWVWINIMVIVVINVLFIGYYVFLHPVPADLLGKEYTINKELPQYIKKAKVDYVFSNQMGVASLVAFYGKTNVYMPKGLWKQFDIWGQPNIKKGDDILYFAFANEDAYKKLKPLFRRVEIDENKRLFAKDSDIPSKTKVLKCTGFKGGRLP